MPLLKNKVLQTGNAKPYLYLWRYNMEVKGIFGRNVKRKVIFITLFWLQKCIV